MVEDGQAKTTETKRERELEEGEEPLTLEEMDLYLELVDEDDTPDSDEAESPASPDMLPPPASPSPSPSPADSATSGSTDGSRSDSAAGNGGPPPAGQSAPRNNAPATSGDTWRPEVSKPGRRDESWRAATSTERERPPPGESWRRAGEATPSSSATAAVAKGAAAPALIDSPASSSTSRREKDPDGKQPKAKDAPTATSSSVGAPRIVNGGPMNGHAAATKDQHKVAGNAKTTTTPAPSTSVASAQESLAAAARRLRSILPTGGIPVSKPAAPAMVMPKDPRLQRRPPVGVPPPPPPPQAAPKFAFTAAASANGSMIPPPPPRGPARTALQPLTPLNTTTPEKQPPLPSTDLSPTGLPALMINEEEPTAAESVSSIESTPVYASPMYELRRRATVSDADHSSETSSPAYQQSPNVAAGNEASNGKIPWILRPLDLSDVVVRAPSDPNAHGSDRKKLFHKKTDHGHPTRRMEAVVAEVNRQTDSDPLATARIPLRRRGVVLGEHGPSAIVETLLEQVDAAQWRTYNAYWNCESQKARKDQIRKDKEKLEKEKKELEQKVKEGNKAELEEATKKIARMKLDAQTSQVRIEDLERQLERAKSDSEHDKSVLKDVTRLKESFKEQFEKKSEELSVLKTAHDALSRKSQQQTVDVLNWKKKYDDETKKISDEQKKYKELVDRHNKLTVVSRKWKEQLDKNNEDRKKREEEGPSTSAAADLQDVTKELRDQLAKLLRENADLKEILRAREEEKAAADADIERLKHEVEEKANVVVAQPEVATCTVQTENKAVEEQLREEADQLRRRLEVTERAKECFRAQFHKLQAQIQSQTMVIKHRMPILKKKACCNCMEKGASTTPSVATSPQKPSTSAAAAALPRSSPESGATATTCPSSSFESVQQRKRNADAIVSDIAQRAVKKAREAASNGVAAQASTAQPTVAQASASTSIPVGVPAAQKTAVGARLKAVASPNARNTVGSARSTHRSQSQSRQLAPASNANTIPAPSALAAALNSKRRAMTPNVPRQNVPPPSGAVLSAIPLLRSTVTGGASPTVARDGTVTAAIPPSIIVPSPAHAASTVSTQASPSVTVLSAGTVRTGTPPEPKADAAPTPTDHLSFSRAPTVSPMSVNSVSPLGGASTSTATHQPPSAKRAASATDDDDEIIIDFHVKRSRRIAEKMPPSGTTNGHAASPTALPPASTSGGAAPSTSNVIQSMASSIDQLIAMRVPQVETLRGGVPAQRAHAPPAPPQMPVPHTHAQPQFVRITRPPASAAHVQINGAPQQPVIPPVAVPPPPAAAPPEVVTAILTTMRGIIGKNRRTSIREIRETLVAAHPGYDAAIDAMIHQAWSRMSQEQQATECTPPLPQQQNQRRPPGAGGAAA